MTEDRPEQERAPISWDALAAELAATRREAEELGEADPGAWDAVAAELASWVGFCHGTDPSPSNTMYPVLPATPISGCLSPSKSAMSRSPSM